MLRNIANIGLSMLMVVVLVWGGCISCSQYFRFAAPHGCCDPVGHCHQKTPTSKTCSIQPVDVPAVAHFIAPEISAASIVPPKLVAEAAFAPAVVSIEHSPPDLCKLHSVFRI